MSFRDSRRQFRLGVIGTVVVLAVTLVAVPATVASPRGSLTSGSARRSVAAPKSDNYPVTLVGQLVLQSGRPHDTVAIAPPKCARGEVFLVTDLAGGLSPTATFPNGGHQAAFPVAWALAVPILQRLQAGGVRRAELAFALGSGATPPAGLLNGEQSVPGGVRAALSGGRVNVRAEVFADVGHNDVTINVYLTGRCGRDLVYPR